MIVIVDYGVGNLASIINMLKKAGAKAIASSDPNVLQQAEKLILPGVGPTIPGHLPHAKADCCGRRTPKDWGYRPG